MPGKYKPDDEKLTIFEPKVCWQWDGSFSNPDARTYMGLQRNPDGTGYHRLEAGDKPQMCEYCDKLITYYPHSHTKPEHDAHYT